MNSVEDPSLSGQLRASRESRNRGIREAVVLSSKLFSSDGNLSKDPTALIANDNQIRILCTLNQAYPKSLRSTQISEAAHIHRSTVSLHSNELLELGLIEKSIVSGTERHVNPTLLYKLHDDFVQEIQAFLLTRLEAYPELWSEYTSDIDDVVELERVEANSVSESKTFQEEVKSLFEITADQMQWIMEQMASMQEEIDMLKKRLNDDSKSKTDLKSVVSTFESLSLHRNGGAR
ncbi:MarR family transcriptional regulator [Roseofilum casamattae]|uniref:MarR family transcriptional regulator n=1 Tax=Roseofilum casamattae BLCC-M143 TaxID=3022442 RepID=A0ABT7BZ90_9CYAN|nr:MarR family transcriptional regulator [Roseofilum casamattae]MDJ1184517.1 MarR family transcriptional regulator [Roseofilum casamattae BLCC-M143]